MKSPAVVNYSSSPHSVELREVVCPVPGPDEVILAVKAVGVCGSDLHQWAGSHSWAVNYPVVMGHEFGGVIAAVGSGVRKWREGDRVVSETAAQIDAESPLTRQGLYNLDPSRRGFGYGVDGAMTSFVRVPARCLHRVPKGLEMQEAALTEPCCVAYSAVVVNARVRPGDRIVVLGPGAIGTLCAAMARLCGAEVALVGLAADESRLAVGRQYGCTTLYADDPARSEGRDPVGQWAFARDGLGADGVVDAVGASMSLRTAMEVVRPGGWISKVGWGPQPVNFSLDPLVQKNVTLQGSFSHNWPIWERVLALLGSRALDVRPIIGGVWALPQWQDAFTKMHRGEVVKAVLVPE